MWNDRIGRGISRRKKKKIEFPWFFNDFEKKKEKNKDRKEEVPNVRKFFSYDKDWITTFEMILPNLIKICYSGFRNNHWQRLRVTRLEMFHENDV